MPKEKNERYMPLYLDAFLDSTYHLTPKQQMIYMKMIWWQFHNKKGFENAKHACLMIGVSSREIKTIQSILDEFYDQVLNETVSTLNQNGTELLPSCDSLVTELSQDCYHFVQKRTISEIRKVDAKSDIARENVQKRWSKKPYSGITRIEENRREENTIKKQTKKADVCVSDLDSDFEGLEKEKSDGQQKRLENENGDIGIPTSEQALEAMRTPFAVKAFASDAQAYAEAQAKAAESETAVLYKFGWVLAWLSTYQTPEDAVKRGVGEPELLELFRQAVDTSISVRKAHNPKFVQGVFRNLVEAWTPTARGKPHTATAPNLDLRNIDKQWEDKPKGRTRGF